MGDLYNRRVLNDPTVRLSYGDPLVPIIKPDHVELHLSNDDGYFDALNMLGETITYSRFDKFSNETWAELSGRVTAQELLLDRIVLNCVTYDLDDFQTLLPKELVTAASFPLAHPQQGLGKPIPVVFGNAASTNKVNDAWEMAYVGEDTGNNYYDYLIGRGTFTNITVYRNTIGDALFVVPSGEYAVNTTAYPGFTVIRFSLATSVAPRQANFGGGLHRLFVAADGLATERNFARAIQSLLSNSTWGLGLSVVTASFDTAAAALDTIGGLYCDGVMDTQRTAYDWITQLVNVRGMRLEQDATGAYTVTVDTQASTIKGRFGHGQGQAWHGVVEGGFKGLSTTPVSDAIKSLILEFRKDRQSGQYVLATSSRSVLTVGTEERVQHDFIRDRTTADKTACYWANRYIYENERLSFTAEQSARKIRPGELIQYHAIRPAFNKTFRVMGIERQLTTSDVKARGWDTGIYTYSAGTLPAEPAAITETDYSRQTPTVASSLSVSASGVETNDQGVKAAYLVVQYTVPDESWARTVVKFTKDGETLWTSLPGENGSGVKTTKIAGLVGSQVYDLRVVRENLFNATLTTNADLANQTAPGDTTAPSDPTAITVRQAGARVVEITITATPPSDWGTTIFYRNTTNNSGTATEIGRGKTKRWTDQEPDYGQTRYYWAKIADQSGNLSGFSPSSSHSVTMAKIVTGDVGDDQITTPKLPANAITAHGVYSYDSAQTLSTSATKIGDITISTDGGATVIIAITNCHGTSSTGLVHFVLYKGDGVTPLGYCEAYPNAGDSRYVPIALSGYDSSPSGSQRYTLYAWLDTTGYGAEAIYVRLIPLNAKR